MDNKTTQHRADTRQQRLDPITSFPPALLPFRTPCSPLVALQLARCRVSACPPHTLPFFSNQISHYQEPAHAHAYARYLPTAGDKPTIDTYSGHSLADTVPVADDQISYRCSRNCICRSISETTL